MVSAYFSHTHSLPFYYSSLSTHPRTCAHAVPSAENSLPLPTGLPLFLQVSAKMSYLQKRSLTYLNISTLTKYSQFLTLPFIPPSETEIAFIRMCSGHNTEISFFAPWKIASASENLQVALHITLTISVSPPGLQPPHQPKSKDEHLGTPGPGYRDKVDILFDWLLKILTSAPS